MKLALPSARIKDRSAATGTTYLKEKGISVSHLTNSIKMGQKKTLGDVVLGDLKSGSQKIVEGTAAAAGP